MSNRCFLCDGPHLAGECTTYHTLEERENAAETLKLCFQCLQPAATAHLHNGRSCNHCGKEHHRALCPFEPWRRRIACAFCLECHHSDDCGKYRRLRDRLRAVDVLKICRRCLSRSHLEDGCTSMQRCKRCKELHHHALCTMGHFEGNAEPGEAEDIEITRITHGSKSTKAKTRKSSSEKTKEGQRELRLAKKAKRRAKRELNTARKERDDAQDKCKALERRIRSLEEENCNCEAIRQVTTAAVAASIEIVTNREEVRRRAIEQERDDAAKKLLEAEKRIEALKKAASDAVRLTLEFQAWRIRALIKAKKGGVLEKKSNKNFQDASTLPEEVSTTVQKTVKSDEGETPEEHARKRAAASSASAGKRRRTDNVKSSAEQLSLKLDAVLSGYPEPVAQKYKLFFVENLRSIVTIEELVEFVRLRCPNDVDLATNIQLGLSAPL